MKYFVYILQSESSKKIYIGQTEDIDQRIEEHNSGKSVYTRHNKGPWKIIFANEFDSRSEAIVYERKLKRYKSRKYILNNIIK